MSKKDKLISRFLAMPNDFTFDEMVALLKIFGYELLNNDGSRRAFVHPETKDVIYLHEPHPNNIMKKYALKDVKARLEEQKYL